MGSVLATRFVESLDLWCVKAMIADAEAPGYYGVAKYVYQVMFMIPMALTGAMFPTLAQAIRAGKQESCRELIGESFRFIFVTMLLAVALVGCSASEVVRFVFSERYIQAAAPAWILAAGAMLFSLRAVGHSILVAAGKPLLSFGAFLPLLPLDVALNLYLVPRHGLIGAALATALTQVLAAVIFILLVWREFHWLFSPLTLIRTLIAAIGVYIIGSHLPAAGAAVMGKWAFLVCVYLLVLVAVGELRRRDFQSLAVWRR